MILSIILSAELADWTCNKMSSIRNMVPRCQNQDILDTQAEEQSLVGEISIKIMETKFMNYVHQLNSSILNCQGYLKLKEADVISKNSSLSLDSNREYSISLGSSRKRKNGYPDNSRRNIGKSYNITSSTIIDFKASGHNKIYLPNGCQFQFCGDIFENVQDGILYFSDSSYYVGKLKNFIPEGHGTLNLKNGVSLEGNFTNGNIENGATIAYDNGDVYHGQIYKFKKHGFGVLEFANGDRYVGDFSHGDITGQGAFYKGSRIAYQGIWKQGQFLGNQTKKLTKSSYIAKTYSSQYFEEEEEQK